MKISALIADDHPVVLLGVRTVLERSRVQVVGEARSVAELFTALESTRCDILVTDLAMPGDAGPDGVPMVQRILRQHPRLPVVLMTMVDNIGIIDTLLRAGVVGVIDKRDQMDALGMAVCAAISGIGFVSPELRRQVDHYRYEVARGARLSPREVEVLRLLASGLYASQIAQRQKRSLKTISKQKISGMRKLGLESDTELYAYARDHGLM